MRGVTNAIPAGGGLKVIASGMLPETEGGFTESSFSLPEPATFVIIYRYIGEDKVDSAALMRYRSEMGTAKMAQAGNGGYSLSSDGMAINYWDTNYKKTYYTAYA